jgi:hypothetical protein
MADLATQRDITTIPKVELHVHLNGSITEGTASELARRHGADPEQVLRLVDGRYPARYPDFEGSSTPTSPPTSSCGRPTTSSSWPPRFCSFTAAVYTRQGEPTIDR